VEVNIETHNKNRRSDATTVPTEYETNVLVKSSAERQVIIDQSSAQRLVIIGPHSPQDPNSEGKQRERQGQGRGGEN
jgi:hypothetical protein